METITGVCVRKDEHFKYRFFGNASLSVLVTLRVARKAFKKAGAINIILDTDEIKKQRVGSVFKLYFDAESNDDPEKVFSAVGKLISVKRHPKALYWEINDIFVTALLGDLTAGPVMPTPGELCVNCGALIEYKTETCSNCGSEYNVMRCDCNCPEPRRMGTFEAIQITPDDLAAIFRK